MNILTQRSDDLGEMRHSPILTAVETVLRQQTLFTRDVSGRLWIGADAVARAVVGAKKWSERELLKLPRDTHASVCTLNMTPEERDAMRQGTHQIARQIQDQLATYGQRESRQPHEILDLHSGPPTTTSPFGRLDASEYKSELGRRATATRKRLTFKHPASGRRAPLMRWHKLTLTVEVPQQMTAHMAEAIGHYLLQQWKQVTADEREDLEELLEDQVKAPDSELAQLTRGLQTETIGQVKKEALLHYLIFLGQQLAETDPARGLLREIVRRLRRFQAWLRRPDKADVDYEITLGGETLNLRTLFAQANAWDPLPVIPIIDGYIGETTNWQTTEQQHIFGIKMKLNGEVARFKKVSSFTYHLDVLRGRFDPTPTRRARFAALYFAVFADPGNTKFDPGTTLESDILPRLRTQNADAAGEQVVLDEIVARCEGAQIDPLVRSLRRLLQRTTIMPTSTIDVQIALGTGIVDTTRTRVLREGRVLHDVLTPDKKAYLGYVTVGEPRTSEDNLFKLRAEIRIEDVPCYENDGVPEPVELRYNAAGYRTLPVFLTTGRPNLGGADTPATPGVVVNCQLDEEVKAMAQHTPGAWFIYRYTFTLVTYLALHELTRRYHEPLFISIVRSHQYVEDEEKPGDPEGFIAMLGKLLAQVLSQDHPANSQGLVRPAKPGAPVERWKLRNAAASLYTPLPKIFQLPTPVEMAIPKLAILVVSARESDRVREQPDGRWMTLVGEVIKIEQQTPDTVQVGRAATIGGTYPETELYSRPTAILDAIHNLYMEGFRHILYVAQAPYSSVLHLTRGEDREGLYFMSHPIIEAALHGKDDLRIYPIFRDHYHAMKISAPGATALYIQDTLDLTRVVDSPGGPQQMVVFLNLFSGQAGVGRKEADGSYNGVVSYATLLNMYGGVLDDNHLRAALINDAEGANPLKDTIVRYLTLFHLSRYEVAGSKVNLKLDPYSDIIGDESIGKRTVQAHMVEKLRFNFLAFLGEVRNVVQAAGGSTNGRAR